MKRILTSLILLLPYLIQAQINDCVGAEVICSDSQVSFTPQGPGVNDFASSNNDNGCLSGNEHQSAWYYFEINDNAPPGLSLGFIIDPDGGSGEDYDFAIYGPDVPCNNLGNPIRCSYAAASCALCPQTGLGMGATDNSEGAGGDGFVAPMIVQPGQGFYLVVDNWLGSSTGFSMDWTGPAAPFLNCTPDCDVVADAGMDITVCEGTTNFTLMGSATGTSGLETYSWTSDPTGLSYLNDPSLLQPTGTLPSGFTGTIEYIFSVIDTGCTEMDTVIVEVIQHVTTIDPAGPFCETDGPVVLTATPSGGTWGGAAGAGGTFDPSALGVGTHNVTYTHTDANGCTAMDDINIDVVANPTVTIDPAGPFCIDAGVQTLIGSPPGGTWAGANGAGQIDPGVLGVGSHIVTYDYTDANGCSGMATITISVLDLPTIAIAPAGPFCIDAGVQTLIGGPSGGTWGGAANAAGQIDPNALGVGSHTVTYEFTDSNGCTNMTSITIEIVGLPTVTIVPTGPFCEDAPPQTLSAIPPGGTWSGDVNGLGQIDPSSLGVGSYTATYTYTDANGCTNSDMTTVDVVPLPTVAITPAGPFCEDAPIQTLSANPPGGIWGGVASPSGQINPMSLGSGTHTVTYDYTDANGCTGTDMIDITILALPTITINPAGPFCEDATVQTLTATPAGGTWGGVANSAGEIDPSTLPVGQHPVTYTYTDADGCTNQETIFIEIVALPTVTITPAGPFCEDAGIQTLTATPPGGTWGGDVNSLGQIIPSIMGVGTYTATYTYTDANGCTNDDMITFDIVPLPVVSITPAGPFCNDAPIVTLTAMPLGGVWGGVANGAGQVNPASLNPGTHAVTYTYTDANGCANTDQITIEILALPTVTITPAGPFCEDAPVQTLSATPPGGVWGGVANAAGQIDPSALGVGSHTVSYTYTDGNGCSNIDQINIQVVALPTVSISGGPFCVNAGIQALIGTPSGGTWGGVANSFGQVDPANLGVGFHPVSYTYTDGNGCTNTALSNVQIVDLPVVTINPIDAICLNAGIQTLIGNPAGGIWGGVANPAGQVDPNSLGVGTHIATYTYTDGNGCTNSASIPVEVLGLPTLFIIPAGPFCSTDGIQTLTANPAGGTWSGSASPNGDVNPSALGTGTHTVIYTYTDPVTSCTNTTQTTIDVIEVPTADFIVDDPICIDDFSTITYVGNAPVTANYNWNFNGGTVLSGAGQGPFTVQWNSSGTKTITLSVDDLNCSSTIESQTVEVEPALVPPVIDCTSSTSSVEFSWSPVLNASSYTVNVLTGQTGTQNGNSFLITGLTANTVVTIELVITSGNSCPDIIELSSCTALDCPDIFVNIDPIPGFCAGTSSGTIDIGANLTVNGSDGTGTGFWFGNGIIDPVAGIFDPTDPSVIIGGNQVNYIFSEAGCDYVGVTTIDIFESPTSDFVVNTPVCFGDDVTVNYTGTASPSATYTWNFNGATVISGSGAGPYVLSWATPGQKTISLTVSENSCSSDLTTQTVQIDEALLVPIVNCASTLNSVSFSWDAVTNASGYQVNVLSGPSGTLMGTTYTVTGLSVGEEVTIELIALSGNSCPDVSVVANCSAEDCPVITVDIDPVASICLDAGSSPINLVSTVTGSNGMGTGVWSGNGIIDATAGVFDPTAADVVLGINVISYTYSQNGCDYTASVNIEVLPVPTADFTVVSPICLGETTMVSYTGTASGAASFAWDFDGATIVSGAGVGPYTLSWNTAGVKTITLSVNENGCSSTMETQTVEVDATLQALVINCMSTINSVSFSWDAVTNASGYQVNVLSGPSGTLTGTTYTVTGLTVGESVTIEVIALSDNACPDVSVEASCAAEDCPVITVDIDPVASICLESGLSPINLVANLTGASGMGTETWSGNGIIDAIAGVFDPTAADVTLGINVITYTYTQDGCDYTSSVNIEVLPVPTADFTVVSPICIEETTMVNYTGTASSSATYTWDFDGATIVSGTGAGPYTLSWNTTGTKTIILSVNENGCSSTMEMQTVEVDATLQAPVINCMSTINSVSFSWDAVTNASGYQVNVLSGPSGTLTGTTYTITGLSVGESVTIEVIALSDNVCPDVSVEANCAAEDCPAITVDIDPVASICLEAGLSPINLVANLTGDNGMGTETWSGNGIIDATAGIFDPTAADVTLGINVISYTYTQDGCDYTSSVNIEVLPVPTADFTVVSPICIEETTTVTYTGTASNSATYTWDFDGATIVSGTEAGPYNLSWSTAGTKTISLSVNENGCSSVLETQTVDVDAILQVPVINCMSTINSVTFSWAAVVNASGYQVNVLTGQTGSLSGTTYTVTGLSVGESVTIEVIALSDNTCPDVSVEASCAADDCPAITVDIDPVASICLASGLSPINLVANLTGASGMGTETWSGNGIIDATAGVFDPTAADVVLGINVISYSYTQDGCDYTSSVNIEVLPVPTADFTVVSPICIEETTTVTYTGTASNSATYTWDFDGATIVSGTEAGPYNLSWSTAGTKTISLSVNENGCSSVLETQTVDVDAILQVPVINCMSTINSVTFSWAAVVNASGYQVNVLTGQTGSLSGTTYTVTGLSVGESVTIEVIALSDNTCPDVSVEASCAADDCPVITVDIDPVASICLASGLSPINLVANLTGDNGMGTETWSGNGIIDATAGIFDPTAADVALGINVISYTYTQDGCDYTSSVNIEVLPVPTADFTVISPICIDETTMVNYTGSASSSATYTWDFDGATIVSGTGAGPYTLSWNTAGTKTISLSVNENGCSSVLETQTVDVDAVLQTPVINCMSTINSVTFSWAAVANASGYQVNVLTGQTGSLSGTTYTVTGLSVSESVTIEVIALSDNACPDVSVEVSCSADDCPVITVDIDPVASICLESGLSPINLVANLTGANGMGTETWSGNGIIDATAGVFDPTAADVALGINVISYTYTQDGCDYTSSVNIEVLPVPTADFTVVSPICIEETTTVNYTGTASNSATYTWDFDGATIVSGTGAGPYTLSWNTAGIKTISLSVNENGCSSVIETQTVEVDATLQAPVINCMSTINSVSFSWATVANASGYQVNVLTGQTGSLSGTTYTVTGLGVSEMVTIELISLSDNACPDVMVQASCSSDDCPMIDLNIDPVADICLFSTVADVNLSVNVSGSDGTGTGLWSGNGIIDAVNGIFDPNSVDVSLGTNTVTYSFEELGCDYTSSIDIEILAVPTADFTVETPLCLGETSIISYVGTGSSNAVYNWNFDGGQIQSGTNQGPFEISWTSSGTKNITLEVIENNCASPIQSQIIQVDEPLLAPIINCNTTTSSVEFSWDPVVGAASYNLTVLSGQTGSFTSATSYMISNLNNLEQVDIELSILSSNTCPDQVVSQSCIADDCPNVLLEIAPVADICLATNSPIENLNVLVTGGSAIGVGTWSGVGITDATLGIFDPTIAGVGNHAIVYAYQEDNCSYNESITITVIDPPIAEAGLGGTIDCNLTSIVLDASASTGSGAVSYSWTGPAGGIISDPNQETITVELAGTYTVVVESLGCIDSDEVEVFIDDELPIADAGPSKAITCNVACVELGTTNTVIGPEYTYEWTGPAGVIANTPFVEVCDFGTYELVVTNTMNGCQSAISSVDVVDNTIAPFALVQVLGNLDCFTVSLGLDGSGSANGSNIIYQWYDDNGMIPGANEPMYNASIAGQYSLLVLDTLSGCSSSDTSLVEDITAYPNANAGDDDLLTCAKTEVVLDGSASASSSVITYNWIGPAGGILSGNNTVNPTVILPGEYILVVVDTMNSCEQTDTVFVDQDIVLPIADAGQDQQLECNLLSTDIGGDNSSAGPQYLYAWTTTSGYNFVDPSLLYQEVDSSGNYSLMVTNIDNGCTAVDDVEVIQNPNQPGEMALGLKPLLCYGDTDAIIFIDTVIGGEPPFLYSIGGESFSPVQSFTNLGPGEYEITVEDINGCTHAQTIEIFEPEELVLELGEDQYLELGDSAQLQALYSIPDGDSFDTIFWSNASLLSCTDCFDPHTSSLVYFMNHFGATLITENGCVAEDRVTIFVEKDRLVYIPNVFSPNNDGENDLFTIFAGKGVERINSFQVFSRWGELVYEANDFLPNNPAIGWDGTLDGQEMNPAVFAYYAEIEFTDGEVILYKGDVTLVR